VNSKKKSAFWQKIVMGQNLDLGRSFKRKIGKLRRNEVSKNWNKVRSLLSQSRSRLVKNRRSNRCKRSKTRERWESRKCLLGNLTKSSKLEKSKGRMLKKSQRVRSGSINHTKSQDAKIYKAIL
jgi:hypothetical protein